MMEQWKEAALPEMLTIRVRKKYRVVSEFEIPAYRFEGTGLAIFLRAIYVASVTSEPQEMVQYYVNSRKGFPVRSPVPDLQNAWHPERREVGHCCGTLELRVEAMRTLTEQQYDAFEKLRKLNLVS